MRRRLSVGNIITLSMQRFIRGNTETEVENPGRLAALRSDGGHLDTGTCLAEWIETPHPRATHGRSRGINSPLCSCFLRRATAAALIAVSSLFVGCASEPMQAYSGDPRPLSDVAVVEVSPTGALLGLRWLLRMPDFQVYRITPCPFGTGTPDGGREYEGLGRCFALTPGQYEITTMESWNSWRYVRSTGTTDYYTEEYHCEPQTYRISLKAGRAYHLRDGEIRDRPTDIE